MDLLANRNSSNKDDILEKRFIGTIMREEFAELNQNQMALMSSRGFTTDKFYNDRGFEVIGDNKGQYTHPLELRFIDMKNRTTNGSKKKKKSHPVHNKPIYGMINNMLRRLSFEYTSKMKKMLMNDYKIEL